MRADRLLSILLLLQVHRRMTAGDLAQRLEVSERTIHRDMEALGIAGIPVVAERGSGGGWHLMEQYRTNLTGLNEAEIQALFLAGPPRLLADLGLHKASEAALIKLLAALPSTARRDAESVRQRILIDTSGWHAEDEDDVSVLPILQEAVWQERKVLFTYQRGDTPPHERLVDPLGLVAKGGTWYFIVAVEGELRTYRVSRIRSAMITDQCSARPPGFDLAAYWKESATSFIANLPRYHVTVRIRAESIEHIYHAGRYVRIERREAPGDDGWLIIHLQFEQEESACGYLLSFGDKVEIIEPRELREKVMRLAETVLACYQKTEQQVLL